LFVGDNSVATAQTVLVLIDDTVRMGADEGVVTLAIFTCQAANLPSAGRHKINRLRQGPQSQNGLEIGYTRAT
jgi:hypothetical protein